MGVFLPDFHATLPIELYTFGPGNTRVPISVPGKAGRFEGNGAFSGALGVKLDSLVNLHIAPVKLEPFDLRFVEGAQGKVGKREIARAFNIPAPLLGDLSRATWKNLESKHREFWSTTLEPWLLALEAALRRALFLPEEREHYVIRFDRDDFGRSDLSARAVAINSLIASKVLNANEGREWLGLKPREGGNEFTNPNINPEKAPLQSIATAKPAKEATE